MPRHRAGTAWALHTWAFGAVMALLAAAWLLAMAPPAAAVAYPGPDGFGYVALDQSEPGGPAFSWTSIMSDADTKTWKPGDDDLEYVELGFEFMFYGKAYDHAYLADNGFLGFDGWNSWAPTEFPQADEPNAMAAPYWMDVDPGCGGEFGYLVEGTPGSQVFTVEWSGVLDYWTCSYKLNAQAKLFEETGCILMLVDQADGTDGFAGEYAALGIEDADGADGISYGFGSPGPTLDDSAVLYCPYSFPEAQDDTASVYNDGLQVATIDALANDNDPWGTPLQIVGVDPPGKGTAWIEGDPPAQVLRYAPGPLVDTSSGPDSDSFTYTIDSATAYAPVTATVDVTILPATALDVGDDTLSLVEDDGAVDLFVLANDADPDGLGIDILAVDTPAKGTATIEGTFPGEWIRYTPDPDANTAYGAPQDAFTYTAKSANSALAYGTVSATIAAVNDAPAIVGAAAVTVPEDADFSAPWATLSAGPTPDEALQLVTLALTVDDPGLFALGPILDGSGVLSFEPKPEACGATTLTLTVTDDGGTALGGADTTSVAVPLTVACGADAPLARDDVFYIDIDPAAGPEEHELTVLANDEDADAGDVITAAPATQPAVGLVATGPGGLTLTYTSTPGWTGDTTFAYSATDLSGLSGMALVTLDVACIGVRALPDHFTTDEDQPLVRTAAAGLGANDAALLATKHELVAAPTHGLAVVGADGSFSYTPHPDFAGLDGFTYRVSDGGFCADLARATIEVQGTQDPPVAVPDTFDLLEDSGPNRLAVLANDNAAANPDAGEVLRLVAVGPAAGGLAQVVGDEVVYTPRQDFRGTDRFRYTVSDGSGTAQAEVTVRVANTPDPPVGRSDAYTLASGQASHVVGLYGVLRNDISVDGLPMSAHLVGAPAHGELTLASDGSFVYRPDPGFRGRDSWSYRPNDGGGMGGLTYVGLDVRPIAHPVAAFGTAQERGVAGMTVRFEDRSTDDGSIVSWSWTFGDGTGSDDRFPLHTYRKAGIYTVVLRVVDDDGLVGQTEAALAVTDGMNAADGGPYTGLPPVADAGADREADEGGFVQLEGQPANGSAAIAYQWRQVAGPAVDLAGADTARPTFTAPLLPRGHTSLPLTFALVVYDGHFESAPDTVTIDVRPRVPGAPRAMAGRDAVAGAGDTVVLAGAYTGFRPGDPVAVSWSQVDGPAVELAVRGAELRFAAPAEAATLAFAFTARSGAASATDVVNVTVQAPEARAGFSERAEPAEPLTVRFTPHVAGPVRWSFGDGSFSRERSPEHTYARPGVYRVVMELPLDGALVRHEHDVRVAAAPGGSVPAGWSGPAVWTIAGAAALALAGGGWAAWRARQGRLARDDAHGQAGPAGGASGPGGHAMTGGPGPMSAAPASIDPAGGAGVPGPSVE